MLLLLACSGMTMQAAEATTQGTVRDVYGNPVFGAVVYNADGVSIGTTDVDGVFKAPVSNLDSKIKVAFLGYKTVETTLTSGMEVELPFDVSNKNQKIHIGNREVERQDFGGAVDVAVGDKLDRQPVARFTSTFAGNFPSVITEEGNTEPTLETFTYKIRGMSDPHSTSPLIVIDGSICYPGTEESSLAYLTTSEIESVTVLKDAASQAVYGGQGANGVIVITTKRGTAGDLRVKAYLDASISQMSVTPEFVSSYQYAKMRNEAAYNDGLGRNYYFSPEQLEGYRTGSDPYLYPNNNWRSQLMRKYVFMQRAAFDVTGGSDWVKYYVNANVLHEGGTFHAEDNKARYKSGDYDNSFSTNTNYMWVNFRSNVEAKICSWLSTRLNISGNVKREHRPGHGNTLQDIYSNMFITPPTVYGPVTPTFYNEDGSVNEDMGYPGDQVIVTEKYDDNAFALVNRNGFQDRTETNINAACTLDVNLDSLTKGLHLSGVFGYHTYAYKMNGMNVTYRRYILDSSSSDFTFKRNGATEDSPLTPTGSTSSYYNLNYRAYLDYNRTFNGVHNVQAQGFAYLLQYENQSLPYNFVNSGFDVSYNFDHRYSIRGVLSYSGCDLYARQSRWQTLPALSLAWNITNEPYFKELDCMKWLTNARVRYTTGKTGNSRYTDMGRYAFEDNVDFAGSGGLLYRGSLTTEKTVGNPNLHAETMKKWNVGIDLGFLNMIDFTFDVYRETMNDWIISNTLDIPEFQGAALKTYPVSNTGIYHNKGWEATLNVTKNYKNWGFSVGGFLAYNDNKVIYDAEATRGEGYAYPYHEQGFEYGEKFGYLVDYSNGNGIFNFKQEIEDWPKYSFGTPRVGDLKYQDLNGDGVIDAKDQAPISTGSIPSWNFGWNGYLRYGDFDLSFMFQGVGDWVRASQDMGFVETSYDGVFSPMHYNAWTAERWYNDEKITFPALSTRNGTNVSVLNNYYVTNSSYVRLKQLEVGYYLPRAITRSFSCQQFKVFLSGNNLYTWCHSRHGVKQDPERNYLDLPSYRTYNIGIRATF